MNYLCLINIYYRHKFAFYAVKCEKKGLKTLYDNSCTSSGISSVRAEPVNLTLTLNLDHEPEHKQARQMVFTCG